MADEKQVTLSITKGQFWSAVGFIVTAIIGAAWGLYESTQDNQNGIVAAQTEIQSNQEDIAVAAALAKEALDEARRAKDGYTVGINQMNVRLARIETILEQMAKNMDKWDSRVKALEVHITGRPK